MKNRDRRLLWMLAIVLLGAVAAGTWYYRSKCHGFDACAAAEAESHERDRPIEVQ